MAPVPGARACPGRGSRRAPEARPAAVAEAIDVARQIAEALEGHNERGVVHRDLKPGNVKVTPDGR